MNGRFHAGKNPDVDWMIDTTPVVCFQGFCCKCGLDATLSASLTGKSGQAFRTKLDCSLWSEGETMHFSAFRTSIGM